MLVFIRRPKHIVEGTFYLYPPGFKPIRIILERRLDYLTHLDRDDIKVSIEADTSIRILRAEHVNLETHLPLTSKKGWTMPHKEQLFAGTLEQCLDFIRDAQLRSPNVPLEIHNESTRSTVWGDRSQEQKELKT